MFKSTHHPTNKKALYWAGLLLKCYPFGWGLLARGVSLQSIFLIPIDTYVDIKRPVPFISTDIFGRPL